ncbi:MAG TPA: Franean1_4349 family RiPP [Desulfuromonadales bacterium]|nr:Franean1_4349 family RiPP [Desulfuromonadales bacterium]
MSQEAVERLLGRLLTDDRLRKRAKESLESACKEEGYDLSAVELRAISHDDITTLDFVSMRLDGNIKRFQGI